MKMGSDFITSKQVEIQIQDQLLKILENIPMLKDVNVFSRQNDYYDIEAITTTESGEQIIFVCEVKTIGEPQYIRKAVNWLSEYRAITKKIKRDNICFMVAAPYISSTSSKICEEHGMGFIDMSGNCLITHQGIYIRVEGKPNKYTKIRKNRSIYERSAVKSSIILRNILSDIKKQWRLQDLAEVSSASVGQVSNVKKFLEEKEYISTGEHGLYAKNPKDIITDWAKTYHLKPNTNVECYSIDSIPMIEQKLIKMAEEMGIEYALTAFAGAVRYSPAVRYNKVHVYIQLQDLQEVIKYLGLKRVESGANVSIIVPYDPCILIDTRNINGVNVASPVQVSLELLGLKGRGEEAAAAIIEGEIIK